MSLFNTKTLLAAVTLAVILPLSAQARPYDVCYAENLDAIGCWLSEKLGGDYIHFGAPEVTEEENAELQTLKAKGYMKLDPIKGKSTVTKAQKEGGKHIQVCKTGEIIRMIKKEVPATKIAASCYK